MAPTQTAIFLDSPNIDWQGGLGWIEYPEVQFMGGSTAWGRYNDSTWIAATFNGTKVSYFGNGVELLPWNFTSSEDNGRLSYSAMSQEAGYDQIAFQWYTSPTLSEGSHLVNLTNITQGVAIDYVVVQPSSTQNLMGQTLIVDQNDPLIKYTGSWKEVSDRYQRIPRRLVTPFNGTIHTSSREGDILQFPFTGSAVRIYGFLDWTVSGQFSLSYAIDGQPPEIVRYPVAGTSQGSNLVQPNYLFYETSVTAGDHVLTINITEMTGGQKVMIDNIQYKATFDTLATMPQVTLPDIVQPSFSASASPSATGVNTSSGSKQGVNSGAIAGGVIGGVVGLSLIFLAIFLFRRKRPQQTGSFFEPKSEARLVAEPFIPPTMTTTQGGTRLEWNNGSSVQVDVPPTKAGLHAGTTSASSTSLPTTAMRDARVENLERRVQELTRQTEELQSPPPYQ